MSNNSSPLVYVVDDDDDDRYLLQAIFEKHHRQCRVRCFENGAALLTQLTHRLDGRLPDLIILDLNMPVLGGLELLQYLRQDSAYGVIPVAVRSGSQHRQHIDRCQALRAAAYLPKTLAYGQLVRHIAALQVYWSPVVAENAGMNQHRCLTGRVSGVNLTQLSMN